MPTESPFPTLGLEIARAADNRPPRCGNIVGIAQAVCGGEAEWLKPAHRIAKCKRCGVVGLVHLPTHRTVAEVDCYAHAQGDTVFVFAVGDEISEDNDPTPLAAYWSCPSPAAPFDFSFWVGDPGDLYAEGTASSWEEAQHRVTGILELFAKLRGDR